MTVRLRDVVGYHAMAREPATYIVGARPMVDEPVSSDEVDAWFLWHPEATCSTRTATALAYIWRWRP